MSKRQDFLKKNCDELYKCKIHLNKRSEATKMLNNIVSQISAQYHYNVWAHHLTEKVNNKCHLKNKEWLYDLVCYKYKEGVHYSLNDTILVMESEWGGKSRNKDGDLYGEVKFDFQKLLLSNSSIKLLVFCTHGPHELINQLYEYFQERINEYNQIDKNSIFVFVRYSNSWKCCDIKTYSIEDGWNEYVDGVFKNNYCDSVQGI